MRSFLLVALLAAAPAVRGQIVSIYGTFSPSHFSNVQTGSTLTGSSAYTNQYTSFFSAGYGGGVTLNVIPLGPVRLGFDLRGSTRPGTPGFDTALAGIKLTFKPPLLPIKPYVQGSGGYLATRSTNVSTVASGSGTTSVGGTFTNGYAAVEGIAGLDYKLIPFFDLRVVEVGVGRGFNTGISFGSAATTNNVTFFTINTGVVFHF